MNYLQVASPFLARWLHDEITQEGVMELGLNDGHGNMPSFRFIPDQPGMGGSAGLFIRTDLPRDAEPEYYDAFLVGPAADGADDPSPVTVDDLVDVWFQRRVEHEPTRGPGSIRGASSDSADLEEDELRESEDEAQHGGSWWPWHRTKHHKTPKVEAEPDPVPMVRTPPAEATGQCETGVKVSVCEAQEEQGFGAMKGLQACERENAPELESVKICFG